MNARDYTNALSPYTAVSNGAMPYLRRLGLIEIMSVLEGVVIKNHVAAARPYLDELDNADERIAFLRATQRDQPDGDALQLKSLDELITEAGIDAILRWGLVECNPGMDINGFMCSVNKDDSVFIYNVFCADLEEKGEAIDEDKVKKAAAAKKRARKKRGAAKKKAT